MSLSTLPLSTPVLDLLDSIEASVDDVNTVDLTRLDEAQVRTMLHQVERISRKVAVTSHTTIAEINDRGSYTRWGYKRLSQMVIGELKISAADAARRIRVAAATVCLRSFTGDVQEPTHGDVSSALFDGDISEHHADEILKVLDKIAAAVDPEKRDTAQRVMTEAAKDLTPRQIEQVGDRLLNHLDPDSPSGSYTDEATDRDAADAAATRDTRSAPQRRHDALKAGLARLVSSRALGSHNGSPAQVVVTITHQQLLAMTGLATTMSGTTIPVVDALEMAKANSMLLAILDAHELTMFLGRTQRLASAAQRIALWLHARGCTFPGCSHGANHTQAHHVTDWAHGGRTNIDEMAPACTEHPEELLAQAWERLRTGRRPTRGDPWVTHVDPPS